MDGEIIELVEGFPEEGQHHPHLEDSVAQRIYVSTRLLEVVAYLGDKEVQAKGFELLNAAIRSISPTTPPLSKLRG
jgi:hypothetical protein